MAQPTLVGSRPGTFLNLKGAADSSRTSITLACDCPARLAVEEEIVLACQNRAQSCEESRRSAMGEAQATTREITFCLTGLPTQVQAFDSEDAADYFKRNSSALARAILREI
jgi:hypothetical protein